MSRILNNVHKSLDRLRKFDAGDAKMSSKNEARVSAFRAKHERELRKLVTIACAVASEAYEGNSEVEETEMNSFAKGVMDLTERTRRALRKTEQVAENKITILRA